jgi:hypothetical protein
VFHEPGSVDERQLESLPDPVRGPKAVIMEVAATSLNGLDSGADGSQVREQDRAPGVRVTSGALLSHPPDALMLAG